MYYASETECGRVFIMKKTIRELGEHFQKNLKAFGGNPDAEYVVYRGKPGKRAFKGYYTLNNGSLKKKPPVNSVEVLLGVYNFLD